MSIDEHFHEIIMGALTQVVEGRDEKEITRLVRAGLIDEMFRNAAPQVGVLLADELEHRAPPMLAERRGPEAVVADGCAAPTAQGSILSR